MLQRQYLDGVEILSVDEKKIIKKLKEIAEEIKLKHSGIKEIILFGSFSKKEYTPQSDIDIAIVIDKTEKKFIERADEFIDYFSEIPLDVNLIVYTFEEIDKMAKSENYFIREIMDGIRL